MPRAAIGYHAWRLTRFLAGLVRARRPVRVVIFGEHSQDWMTALAPDAPVWALVPGVREVALAANASAMPASDPGEVDTVIIPLMEDHARDCPSNHRALVPDRRSIDILADKAAFAGYVDAHGLSRLCPKAFTSVAEATFPCVLKRADLNAGRGVAIVRTRFDLELRLEQAPWRGQPCVLQSLAPGDVEFVTHCVCAKGRVLWHCSFLYELETPDAIRTTDHVRSMRAMTAARGVIASIEAFLAPLAYDGPCNVNYKIAPDGTIIVLEINPRFGGSLMRPEYVGFLARALTTIIDAATPWRSARGRMRETTSVARAKK